MKSSITVSLLCTLGLCLTAQQGITHSGRTDSNGCHTNHRTGEYHCHGGSSGDSNRPSNPSSPSPRPSAQPRQPIYIPIEPAPSSESQPNRNTQPSLPLPESSNIPQASGEATLPSCLSYEQCIVFAQQASQQRLYEVAVLYLRRALEFRPDDTYAVTALDILENLP